MCCDHLVCASCAGPVSEARCPVCRTARAQVHGGATHPVAAMAVIVAVLLALALVLQLTVGR
jgi:hypothetical protein